MGRLYMCLHAAIMQLYPRVYDISTILEERLAIDRWSHIRDRTLSIIADVPAHLPSSTSESDFHSQQGNHPPTAAGTVGVSVLVARLPAHQLLV